MTACPQFAPYFAKKYRSEEAFEYFIRYERHSLQRYYFEFEEFWDEELVDERKLYNLNYTRVILDKYDSNPLRHTNYEDVLKNLENGNLRPHNLGIKM